MNVSERKRVRLSSAEQRQLEGEDLLVQLRVCDTDLVSGDEVDECLGKRADSEGISKSIGGIKLEGIQEDLMRGLRTSVALRVN